MTTFLVYLFFRKRICREWRSWRNAWNELCVLQSTEMAEFYFFRQMDKREYWLERKDRDLERTLRYQRYLLSLIEQSRSKDQ